MCLCDRSADVPRQFNYPPRNVPPRLIKGRRVRPLDPAQRLWATRYLNGATTLKSFVRFRWVKRGQRHLRKGGRRGLLSICPSFNHKGSLRLPS